jgi:hypothetical protein
MTEQTWRALLVKTLLQIWPIPNIYLVLLMQNNSTSLFPKLTALASRCRDWELLLILLNRGRVLVIITYISFVVQTARSSSLSSSDVRKVRMVLAKWTIWSCVRDIHTTSSWINCGCVSQLPHSNCVMRVHRRNRKHNIRLLLWQLIWRMLDIWLNFIPV